MPRNLHPSDISVCSTWFWCTWETVTFRQLSSANWLRLCCVDCFPPRKSSTCEAGEHRAPHRWSVVTCCSVEQCARPLLRVPPAPSSLCTWIHCCANLWWCTLRCDLLEEKAGVCKGIRIACLLKCGFGGLGNGLVGRGLSALSMRTWVPIPSPYVDRVSLWVN